MHTLLAALLLPIATGPTTPPSGEEVLDRYIERMGGREAHAAITTRVSRGRLHVPEIGLEGTFVMYQAVPNQMRITYELDGIGTVEQGTTGETVWEVSTNASRVMKGDERAEVILRGQLHFDIVMGDFFTDIEAEGIVPVDGRPCHAVRMTSPLGHPTTRYFDQNTYELVKETAVVVTQSGVVTGETRLEDYRQVGAVRVPFKVTERVQAQTIIHETDSIEDNVEIPAATFVVPVVIVDQLALGGPRPDEVAWLRANAVPFDTVEAEQGFADLEGLREMIGDARIVSLGESTHGSREIFQMKHRLLEFLATEMGFRIFSIEASLPESFRVSDYAVRGEGDPRALIGGMYFWTWNTHEVLDMVEWMRQFNMGLEAAGDPTRLTFTGFDMQFPDVALGIVREFAVAIDPELSRILAELPPSLRGLRRAGPQASFAALTGSFPVNVAAGKTIRFSGWIRTEDVDGWAGLWWRADLADGSSGAFDNMQTRAPRGDTAWTRYEIELDVPEGAVNINFGMLLSGRGSAWFDGLDVWIDDEPYDATGHDLALDDKGHRGFMLSNPQYRTRTVKDAPREGQACLQLTRVADLGPVKDDLSPATVEPILERATAHLERNQPAYADQDPKDVEWARQNLRVVRQYVGMMAGNALSGRDRSMAENVRWILEENPDAKIVLWAHNFHVSTQTPAMGGHLEAWFGDDHVPIGFATTRGRYTAIGESSLGGHDLQAPPAESVEAFFVEAGVPRAIVDLRCAGKEPGSQWLAEPRPFRSIGALAMAEQFGAHDVTKLFEILVYIEETTASVPLR